MVFLQSHLAETKASGESVLTNGEVDQTQKLDTEQIFQLMDSMLSLEACLYYQVLPLALNGNCLQLGMVNLEDMTAVDYVRQILLYMNYSLLPQSLAAADHRALLSQYLSYTKANKSGTKQVLSPTAGAQAVQVAGTPEDKTAKTNQNDRPTLILVDQTALDCAKVDQVDPPSRQQPNSQAAAALPLPNKALPALEVQAAYLSSSMVEVADLPPQKLLQELLARVLATEIGRLYFEPLSSQYGQIVYSQNGSLQSVWENIPLPSFQAVINELKRLIHLPLTPVQSPKQAEIERFYQQDRILLRLQVMPGSSGEKVTLQVLRGKALKFYQQQQTRQLRRDAMAIAQQLQRKLNQLRERANLNANQSYGQLNLPSLNQLLENVEENLEKLKQLQD